jgi:hypothetical protein
MFCIFPLNIKNTFYASLHCRSLSDNVYLVLLHLSQVRDKLERRGDLKLRPSAGERHFQLIFVTSVMIQDHTKPSSTCLFRHMRMRRLLVWRRPLLSLAEFLEDRSSLT